MANEKFDVVVYEIATRKVDAIVGKNMPRDTGFYNAEKRADTVSPRLNDDFNVAIVPAGKYQKGQFIKDGDL